MSSVTLWLEGKSDCTLARRERSMPTSETEEFEALIDDQLVTLGRSFDDLYSRGRIKLEIDGQAIGMNRIFGYDADRRVPPRRTTVYDAVNELYRNGGSKPQLVPRQTNRGANRPMPVLCHREHMRPAAVCRVCMVELKGSRGWSRPAISRSSREWSFRRFAPAAACKRRTASWRNCCSPTIRV